MEIISTIISSISLIVSIFVAYYTSIQTNVVKNQLKNDFIEKLINNLKELKIFLLTIKPETNFKTLTQQHHLDLEKIRNLLLYQKSITTKYLTSTQKEILDDLQLEAEDVYGFIVSNHPDENLKKRELLYKIDELINSL